MKNIIKNSILTGTILAFLTLAATTQAETKLGTINLRKVFDNYYKTKQADTLLKEEATDMEKERKTMVVGYRKRDEDYKTLLDKANDQAVSADERDKSKKSAEGKIAELKDTEQAITEYERSARAKIGEKQRLKRDAIVTEIRGIIDVKAKAAGYTMVIDTAGETINNTPFVLYCNNESDLTEAVLSQLNAAAPASTDKDSKDDKKTDEKSAK